MNLLFAAMPVFVLALAAEILAARWQGRHLYRAGDSFSNFACALGAQLVDPLLTLVTLAVYGYAFEHLAVMRLAPDSWVTWALAILAVDFTGYWEHRLCHEVNGMWALHVVHHQSEEFNLTVGLRVNWLRNPSVWLLDLPLAVAGIPPEVYLAAGVINQVYQFVLHTRLVGRLGPLEWLFVTPSHHRVHHGTNPTYRDKNYGGIFIVWDKLFGTFVPETEAPVYGLTKPLRSYNPLLAHVQGFVDIWQSARATPRLKDKLGFWLRHPGWAPGDAGKAAAAARYPTARTGSYAPTTHSHGLAYVGLQVLALAVASVALMTGAGGLTAVARAATFAAALTSLALWQGLMLGLVRTARLEAARLALLTVAAAVLAATGQLSLPALGATLAYTLAGAALLRAILKAPLEGDVVELAVRSLAEFRVAPAGVERGSELDAGDRRRRVAGD